VQEFRDRAVPIDIYTSSAIPELILKPFALQDNSYFFQSWTTRILIHALRFPAMSQLKRQ